MNTEFFAQDNWRVKRNFTIDAGVRFYYITPTQSHGDQVAQFEPDQVERGDGAAALSAGDQQRRARRASNPITGRDLSARLSRPPGAELRRLLQRHGRLRRTRRRRTSPFKVAPRLGFAWDVTGDGKTAVRGGAGVFYDRYADDNILDLIELPPLLLTYTTNYTTIPELLSSPLTATTTARSPHQPTSSRRSSTTGAPGVQRDIGWQPGRRRRLCRQLGAQPADQPSDSTAGRTDTPISRRASTRRT